MPLLTMRYLPVWFRVVLEQLSVEEQNRFLVPSSFLPPHLDMEQVKRRDSQFQRLVIQALEEARTGMANLSRRKMNGFFWTD